MAKTIKGWMKSGRHHRKEAARCVALFFAVLLTSALPVSAGELDLPFSIAKPVGDGPFPAVVLMHDCSGLGSRSSGSPARWAAELQRLGYVAILPDSFTSRGFPAGVCSEAREHRAVSPRNRRADAYAALAYLQSLPYVDPKRIAVMGGSHGGSTTLATIVDIPGNREAGKPGFAAAIALYPSCAPAYGAWKVERERTPGSPITGYAGVFKPLAPTLILIGELDDWTPAPPCKELAARAKDAGFPVEIKVYPGAHHSFDSTRPVNYGAGRNNFNAVGGHGATTGGNAEAWADAQVMVKEFLQRTLDGR